MEAFTHEKLLVWQASRVLVRDVYRLMAKFPNTERYGLVSQLGRAIISVSSNIAEGCGRPGLRDRLRFYEIAYGSLMESLTQLTLACDLEMIDENELEGIKPQIVNVAKMLSGLRRNLYQRIKDGELNLSQNLK